MLIIALLNIINNIYLQLETAWVLEPKGRERIRYLRLLPIYLDLTSLVPKRQLMRSKFSLCATALGFQGIDKFTQSITPSALFLGARFS
jgi:hypothetical protein